MLTVNENIKHASSLSTAITYKIQILHNFLCFCAVYKDITSRIHRLQSQHHLKMQELESTLACKQPNVDSGATAIGSAGRAPDKVKEKSKEQKTRVFTRKDSSGDKDQANLLQLAPSKFECSLRKQHKDLSLCSPASSQT